MDNKKELLKYIDMCQASWTNETSMDYILMNGGQGDMSSPVRIRSQSQSPLLSPYAASKRRAASRARWFIAK